MELLPAVRRYLLSSNTVVSLVSDRVWKWDEDGSVEGTGQRAIVLNQGPGWAGPDPVQSSEFPTLQVDAIADHDRGPGGEIDTRNGEDKAMGLIRAVIPLFRYPAMRGEWIGAFGSHAGLLVISSQLWAHPRFIRGADAHPPNAGETVRCRIVFALNVAPHG